MVRNRTQQDIVNERFPDSPIFTNPEAMKRARLDFVKREDEARSKISLAGKKL